MDCAVTDAAISADNAYYLETALSQLGVPISGDLPQKSEYCRTCL